MGWEDDMSGLTGEDKINARHPVYISKAFEYAGKYAGKGLLEIRDISFEFNPTGKKAKAIYQLILHLRAKGLRVDALGLQCHMYNSNSDSYNYNNFIAVCRKFKALGLELYVAELDMAAFGNLELQKQRYKEFIGVCGRAGVDHVYFWGVADGKDPNWRTYAQPLLFDADYNKKPAYYGVLEALQESEN
jgi:endo-1,4-beta-xylanase